MNPPPLLYPSPGTTSGRIVLHHFLIDGTEDRPAIVVEHLDPDVVAEFHEGCHGLAGVDRLAHPPLGDAGAAGRRVAVGDRARTDHGTRLEVARPGGVGDQLAEIE